MVNLLGLEPEDPHDAHSEVMALYPSVKAHVCGKEVGPDRKLGHVTMCGDDLDTAEAQACETVETLVGRGASAGSLTTRG